MNVVIFGASGGVGTHLVRQAVAAGHRVTAVVREGTPFSPPPGVNTRVGNVLDPAFVSLAVEGASVVLSALGIRRVNARNPWSPLASPPDFCSVTARHVVSAMVRHGVSRVVAISAAGVADSAVHMNALMRFMVARSNVGVAYRDLAVMEGVYAAAGREHGIAWQCVRPTRLTDGAHTQRVVTTDAFPSWAAISRADVAGYVLRSGTTEPPGPPLVGITGG